MKQQQIFWLGLLVLALTVNGGSAIAQENTGPGMNGSGRPGGLERNVSPQAQERLLQRQERGAAVRERLRGLWQERTGRFVNLASRRFDAALNRLSGLLERLEARLTKLAELKPETDFSAAETALAEARAKLGAAKLAFDNFQSQQETLNQAVATNLENKTPEPFAPVRQAIQAVHTELRAAHQSLQALVGELKKLVS